MNYIFFLSIFIGGCISNPNYDDSVFERHLSENPNDEKQIKENQRESKYQQTFSSESTGSYYTIVKDVKEAHGFGGKDDPIWIGYENVKYRHEILVTVVCKNPDMPTFQNRLSYKSVQWKISEKLKGSVTANLNGVLRISFESEDSNKVDSLLLTIKDRIYKAPLQGSMILEVEPELCAKN